MRKRFQHWKGAFNYGRGNAQIPGLMRSIFLFLLIVSLFTSMRGGVGEVFSQGQGRPIYLPIIRADKTVTPTQTPTSPTPPPQTQTPVPTGSTPVINMPFWNIANSVISEHYGELAVGWFGKVTPTDNFTDIRIGYNQQKIYLQLSIYDRQLWYSEQPSAQSFNKWDSTSVYLTFPNASSQAARQIRLDAMLSNWEQSRSAFQAAYENVGGSWTRSNIAFSSTSAWRGEDVNGSTEDRGWIVTYEIPFASLGYTSRPTDGTNWKMGLKVYDQDTGTNGTVRTSAWPVGFSEASEGTFGRIGFGLPGYTPPSKPVAGTVKIQNGPNTRVEDGSVGGNSMCGAGMDYWTEWGNHVYNTSPDNQVAVVQNQGDIADWPCFSRYYITFPLNTVPSGKVIISAKLTLHHFGNSQPADAEPSYIQVLRVGDEWHESTLSWNNSPQAVSNYPGVWVAPLRSYPGVPGVAYTWDVSRAVIEAYNEQKPLRLALYDSDWDYHSGKYFHSSETSSWSTVTPPTLTIQWGNP